MFSLRHHRLEIKTAEQLAFDTIYGFDLTFQQGLNIIAAPNSKGKSTINSCIYYALGMEELLGGQDSKALDKALKSEFNIINPNKLGTIERHTVLQSKILAELLSDSGEIVTLERFIIPGSARDYKITQTVTIYFDSLSDLSQNSKRKTYYIKGEGNNDNESGFYKWFADFIGLELPSVSNNTTKGEGPLYLQCLFSALFIEQTKGWSDFFATMPYFGIPRVKEKVVEYILSLKELELTVERDRLSRLEKELTERWHSTYHKLNLLALENSGELISVPNTITDDKNKLTISNILIKESQDAAFVPLSEIIVTKQQELNVLKEIPILRVSQNKQDLRKKYEVKLVEHRDFLAQFQLFDTKLNLQKQKYLDIIDYKKDINSSLSKYKGIRRVFEMSLVKEDVYDTCPTCNQHISTHIIESKDIKVEKSTLEENIAFLESQKKLVDTSIESLKKIVEEKEGLRRYFVQKQRELEEDIKFILQELIADDKDYSENEALKRVRLEKKIIDYTFVLEQFGQLIDNLKKIAEEYFKLLQDRAKLEKKREEDVEKLETFEKVYKNELLFPFWYTSNDKENIFIQLKEPFKYFPVYKFNIASEQPQSIRINSSASDFVRNLWAYTLSLLQEGSNHPGVVIFDEPGQHRTDSKSLKALFEKSAKMKDKQIIIFTSVDKDLEDGKIDLDAILQGLKVTEDYSLYRIGDNEKAIKLLN